MYEIYVHVLVILQCRDLEVHITLILSQLYFYMLCAKKHILLICYACYNCHATAINIKVLAQSEVVLLTCIYMQTDRDTRE